MSWLDWLLLSLVVGYFLYLVFRKKKGSGCCGNCSGCSGCAHKKE